MTGFEPYNPRAVIGNNRPPEVALFQQIDDLYDTAKDFADGQPIEDDKMEAVITGIYNDIHKLGKEADDLRVAEKKPHDDAIAVIQSRFNPFVQKDKGKVDMGKKALDELLGRWRIAKQQAAAAEARRVAEAAEAARQAANAAMRSSSGNLAAREEAEVALAEAKALEKTAKRADKAATTGTGLVTRWVAVLDDEETAMDWTWGRAKAELLAVAQSNADAVVRAGVRSVPGFRVEERKEAR